MDPTKRQITKIAREAGRFALFSMKPEGIGTAEFDFLHLVRHNPGITQAQIRKALNIDKGAAARRTASLEAKGYLIRKENPADKRSMLLYATEKADGLKNSKAFWEAAFYQWLLQELSEKEQQDFCKILQQLYLRSKSESRSGFQQVSALADTLKEK